MTRDPAKALEYFREFFGDARAPLGGGGKTTVDQIELEDNRQVLAISFAQAEGYEDLQRAMLFGYNIFI